MRGKYQYVGLKCTWAFLGWEVGNETFLCGIVVVNMWQYVSQNPRSYTAKSEWMLVCAFFKNQRHGCNLGWNVDCDKWQM